MRAFRTGTVAFAVCLVVLAALPGAALAAKPTFIHDSWDVTDTITDLCGFAGLTAQVHSVGQIDSQIHIDNQSGFLWFSDHLQFTDIWTGPNGSTVTVSANQRGRDSSVVDNGDGTITDYWTVTGSPFTVTLLDGTSVADHGRVTYVFIYDLNGTPLDTSDDSFVSFEGTQDVAGPHPSLASDVFCTAAINTFTS